MVKVWQLENCTGQLLVPRLAPTRHSYVVPACSVVVICDERPLVVLTGAAVHPLPTVPR